MTTIALALAEMLASLRADRVAVFDAEPHGGTVGLRAQAEPGEGLLPLLWQLDAVEKDGSYSAWARFGTTQHDTWVTVFGRHQPQAGAELDVDLYQRVVIGLARHWPIVLVDTSRPEGRTLLHNGQRFVGHGLQEQAINSAHVLVVVGGPGQATVESVSGWLRGVRVPASQRVGVVAARSGGDPSAADALLRSHTSGVVHVPIDPALDADAPLPLLRTAQLPTHDALLHLAALVVAASQTRGKSPASREVQTR